MNREKFESNPEVAEKISLEAPVVESFLDPARAAEVWPEKITTNETFLQQTTERKELNDRLNDIFDCLPKPDISFESAIKQGHITEEQAEKVYKSLSKLLESDQGYNRIALYLPFELMPDKKWQPVGEKLRQASEQFRQSYMKAWKSLLTQHDVRANFVDGDVLEAEHRKGDLPRVVKAAHLIPKLVEKGFMGVENAITLMEESDDPVLKNSIADALGVLADMGLITKKEIELMEKSEDQLVRSMAHITASGMQKKERAAGTKKELKKITFLSVKEKLAREFSKIDKQKQGNITKKRDAWLTQKKKQEVIESLGENISLQIVDGNFESNTTEEFLTQKADGASQQALIEGIRKAIESVETTDAKKSQELYNQYKETLLALWENNNSETKEALAKTFRRFFQLGIVDNIQLAELNITVPKLAGPFSENLKTVEKEMVEVQSAVASIETNPELSQMIYPIALVFGSKLKGYGAEDTDIDTAVLIKPEVPFNEREKLQKLLRDTFSQEKIQGEVVEFWLQEKEGKLSVRDFDEHDTLLGENYWTYILFGAAWQGDKNAIRELREKLLVPYMYDTDKKIKGQDARALYLSEIERDALQYRLMHKGYERSFPSYGGIHTAHADEIDGESMFYDSGYRQLATKLFASRVFLPKLP